MDKKQECDKTESFHLWPSLIDQQSLCACAIYFSFGMWLIIVVIQNQPL